MRFTRDRNDFIRQMQEEFTNHNDTETVSDPPTLAQMRKLFRYLRGAVTDAENAFRSYAGIFFIHGMNVRNPGDVTYPGGSGRACDSFAEVMNTRMENNCHVIDCEGYAVMAVELLREAGFRFVGYIVSVSSDAAWSLQASMDRHVMAEIRYPVTQTSIYISNASIYPSLAQAVEGIGWDPRTAMSSHGQTIIEADNDLFLRVMGRRASDIGDAISGVSRRWRRIYPWTHTPR